MKRRTLINNYHAPASNTAAVVTLKSTTGSAVIRRIDTGYDLDPTTVPAELTIAVDGTTVWSTHINKGGPAFFDFAEGYPLNAASSGIVITLPAAGASITGRLNVFTERP